MGSTLETYQALQMLKRMDDWYLNLHYNLQSRIDKKSKNKLVICRNKKECREAIKFIAKDHLDKCKIDMVSLKITVGDITIIFMPVSEIEYYLTGYKYNDYYFEEEFRI